MKTKITLLALLVFLIGLNTTLAQVGIGTTTPDAAAVLDLTSTTQGLLPPRMTWAQRDAIATPVQGLMVYCTNCGTNGEPQFYNGAAWVNLVGGTVAGQMQYWDGTAWVVVAPGSTGQVLKNENGVPEWKSEVGDNFVINFATGKIWMDRNLGATQVALSSTDAASYGDLYQWGRGTDGHQIRTSTQISSQSSLSNPGVNFIKGSSNWYTGSSPSPDALWQGVNGVNNPCPSGYRLPTDTEWIAEIESWGIRNDNADGAFASPLKLPMAGYRNYSNGSLYLAGTNGFYWSSTISSTLSHFLDFSSGHADMTTDNHRASGYAVRCIKD